jgi:hypothetical protein
MSLGIRFTVISILFLAAAHPLAVRANQQAPPLPTQSERWLDGKPRTWSDLKGKVVLLNVWTFGCWNSYRSLPWLVSIQKKFPELQIIGVHSPEFDHEKDRKKLRQTMKSYGVEYAQLLDDNHEYWKQLRNHYWPAFYIVDKQGRIRAFYAGETHAGDSQSRKIENHIQALLNE